MEIIDTKWSTRKEGVSFTLCDMKDRQLWDTNYCWFSIIQHVHHIVILLSQMAKTCIIHRFHHLLLFSELMGHAPTISWSLSNPFLTSNLKVCNVRVAGLEENLTANSPSVPHQWMKMHHFLAYGNCISVSLWRHTLGVLNLYALVICITCKHEDGLHVCAVKLD